MYCIGNFVCLLSVFPTINQNFSLPLSHPLGTGNLPALVLPIVFVTLGFLVVVGGAVYIMRLRKKPLVEVADFDFHPTLNESSSGGPPGMRLSLVANTLKYMMTRRKWTGSRQSKPARTETCRLGELENSGSSTRSEIGAHLYEEL